MICYPNLQSLVMGTWWRHDMDTHSALLALCAGNTPVYVTQASWRLDTPATLLCVPKPIQTKKISKFHMTGPLRGEIPRRASLFIYLLIYLFIIYLFIIIHLSLFICLFIYLFIHSSIHSSIHLYIHLFIHSFIYSFIHPSIHSFIHLFIYLFIYCDPNQCML